MASNQTLIVVVGLPFEARLAARMSARVICASNAQNLTASLALAIADDCHGLVSLGVAGGLLPNLSPGTCVIGSEILCGSTRLMTDKNWSLSLQRAIPDSIYGKIAGVPSPVAYPEAKHALYENTGAIAVDMESHIVASIAASHGLPFVAIRVITDPATSALPQVGLAAMRPNGTINIAKMFCLLLKHPAELRALAQTAHYALAARTTLCHVCSVLGSGGQIKWPDIRLKREPGTTASLRNDLSAVPDASI